MSRNREREHTELAMPNGWFAVAFSRDIVPGEVQSIEYFDQSLVLFRSRMGEARVLDAYCPHLGAHLGEGGRVVGDTLRCPFHGWQYDGETGECTHIPYCERIPPRARLKAWDVVEKNEMRVIVRKGLTEDWDNRDDGPRDQFQDYSIELDDDAEKKVLKQMMEEKKRGWAVGPFPRPPFPNRWCERRNAINDWTNRNVPGVVYYTIRGFLSKVARGGRGALISLWDVENAYKNLLVQARDWHQQVIKVAGLFFVQLRGTFGSVTAGDNWIVFIMAIVEVTRKLLHMSGLDCFVDNFDNVVPGVDGEPDMERAQFQHRAFKELVGNRFGLPLHEEQGPTCVVNAHLGWAVDTMRQVVSAPEKRMEMMRKLLQLWLTLVWYTVKQLKSLIGVFAFVSCVIPGLGAPLRWLRMTEHRNFSGDRKRARTSKRLQTTIAWLRNFLTRWNGETRLYDMDWKEGPTLSIKSDASVKPVDGSGGCGAFCIELRKFIAWTATQEVLDRAMRAVQASVPYMELFSIVMVLHTLRDLLAGHRVMVFSDARSMVDAANNRWSDDRDLQELL